MKDAKAAGKVKTHTSIMQAYVGRNQKRTSSAVEDVTKKSNVKFVKKAPSATITSGALDRMAAQNSEENLGSLDAISASQNLGPVESTPSFSTEQSAALNPPKPSTPTSLANPSGMGAVSFQAETMTNNDSSEALWKELNVLKSDLKSMKKGVINDLEHFRLEQQTALKSQEENLLQSLKKDIQTYFEKEREVNNMERMDLTKARIQMEEDQKAFKDEVHKTLKNISKKKNRNGEKENLTYILHIVSVLIVYDLRKINLCSYFVLDIFLDPQVSKTQPETGHLPNVVMVKWKISQMIIFNLLRTERR